MKTADLKKLLLDNGLADDDVLDNVLKINDKTEADRLQEQEKKKRFKDFLKMKIDHIIDYDLPNKHIDELMKYFWVKFDKLQQGGE